jgi:hypothetical protein
MEMKLNLETEPRKFYRQLLELLSSFPPLNRLRNKELDVLAVYLYYNNKYKLIEENLRYRIINDSATRREMQRDLGINEDVFNNNLSLIRKTGVIDMDGNLTKFLQVHPTDKYELIINFNIKKNE